MKQKVIELKRAFAVVLGNARLQAAEMVLAPGKTEGGPDNRHRGSDQWLFVLSGTGIATINDKRHRLRKNVLLLIERGDRHEIRNNGRALLRTLNFYVPPAYTKSGDELPRGRR